MTYLECKKKVEDHGYTVTETDTEIITVFRTGKDSITFDKQTNEYHAVGYGSPLSFTTYPIYEPWRDMIKAWKAEQEKQNEGL